MGKISENDEQSVVTEHPARVERLLDALEDIFQQQGFRRVTVGELAKELRCSRRTLYELAPSKEDLFIRVFDRWMARVRRLGDDAVSTATTPEAAIGAFLHPGVTETRKMSADFMQDVASLPAAQEMWEAHQFARIEGLRRLIEDGMKSNHFKGYNSRLVAEVMMGSVRHLRNPAVLAATGLSLSEALSELYSLVAHGLLSADDQQ